MTAKGVRKKVDLAYGTDSMGIFQTKTSLRGMRKNSSNGAQSIFLGFSRVLLLDATFDIPQKLVCLGFPNGIASRCLINILPDFRGLPYKASDKFMQLGWVGLEGHTATNLHQNLSVIERSVVNTKYQAISPQTLLFLLLRREIDVLRVI